MARKVKCRKCGSQIDQKTAFKVVVGKVNTYYCNEAEYDLVLAERKVKDDTYECINKIFGYIITNTAIYKEINALVKVYGYELILSYLQENFDYLHSLMSRDFEKEYGKIRYFSVVLSNNLADYRKAQEVNVEESAIREVVVDMPEIHYKRKTKRRALDEIE